MNNWACVVAVVAEIFDFDTNNGVAPTQAQLFIMGVSRDPDHSDTTAEGFALRVQIREHILIGNDTQRAGI